MNIKHKCFYCDCKVKAEPIHDRIMHIALLELGRDYQKYGRLAQQNRVFIFKKMIKKREKVRQLVRPKSIKEKAFMAKRIEKASDKDAEQEARIVMRAENASS